MPWGDLPRSQTPVGDGIILVDKPQGVTSHDVVGGLRRLAGTKKVGHAGTLDPMATGLLTVGIGRATKLLTYLTGEDKTYEATIALGYNTTTEDKEGEAINPGNVNLNFGSEQIDAAIAQLTGEIMQVPSAVSAIKIDGKRAHDLVRQGQEVRIPARPVKIFAFDRTSSISAILPSNEHARTYPTLEFTATVRCSAGTYIRALARDLGVALGTGAHLCSLRRTRVGSWQVEDAHTMEELRDHGVPLIAIDEICSAIFPIVTVSDDEARLLSRGMFIERRLADDGTRVTHIACAFSPQGRAVSVISVRGKHFKPDLQLWSATSVQ